MGDICVLNNPLQKKGWQSQILLEKTNHYLANNGSIKEFSPSVKNVDHKFDLGKIMEIKITENQFPFF